MARSREHFGSSARGQGVSPAATVDLQDLPIEQLKGVGLQASAILRSRGIETAGDLLARLPRRYLDLRRANDWGLVRTGAVGAVVALEAVVVDVRWLGSPRRRAMALALREPQGTTLLRAVFFRALPGLRSRVMVGATVRVIGTLRSGPAGPELVHPRVLDPSVRTDAIEPVYSSIGSLPPGTVARLVARAVERADEWADPVPSDLAKRLGLITAAEALRQLHRPSSDITPDELVALQRGDSPAHRRLGFEELLTIQVALERVRRMAGRARSFPFAPDAALRVAERLGIALTDGQRTAIHVLLEDITSDRPMRRLLVGEVGAGKTAVAAAVTLAVLRAGGSVAWLVPTTLVAEQHAQTLQRALGGDGGPIAVLLGSTSRRAREEARRAMAAGVVRMVIGTHAILEDGSTPRDLSLAVIDEQHRFGVAQRLALVAGRTPVPHLLVLSATPIPRTLALARYGDLDVVTMQGRPDGRRTVVTRVVDPGDRAYVVRTIERALAAPQGRVFVVVPRIDADDVSAVTIADVDAWLAKHFGRERVVMVHGRMSTDEQRQAVQAFRRGTHPILLGTSVVEVGLDVPDANLMVVLGAEHFGVAQLHQLRGRVGRNGQRAGCLLVPERMTPEVRERLLEVANCQDGFVLAERDLARRGAGEWFGERQTGSDATLRFADPLRDPDLVAAAAEAARAILDEDPTLARHPALSRAIQRLLARGVMPVAEEAG